MLSGARPEKGSRQTGRTNLRDSKESLPLAQSLAPNTSHKGPPGSVNPSVLGDEISDISILKNDAAKLQTYS